MEDNRIQNQIAIYMTNKKLCEFTDKLKPAPIEYYAHMHAQGEEQADGIRAYSCIGVVLQDYSNGTGDKTVRVTANLSPGFFPFVLSRMLRNSFLMQKDYKIHADVVRLIYQPEWDDLWDLSPEKLSQEYYADRIMKLSESITEAYVASGAGIPTDTLLTKILLGTVGCVPAYDRYFKKALADTGAAPQVFSAKSIRTLGNLYLDHEDEFEKLRKHCGSRIEYPAAKILDMCFFEYGFQRDASSQEDSD